MTTLVFTASNGAATVQVETDAPLRITGGAISAGGSVLAKHTQRGWHVGSQCFERVTFQEPVRIHIPGNIGARSFGPFDQLALADDLIFTPRGVLARYDALEECWYFDRHGSQCDVLVLEPTDSLERAHG